MCMSNESTNLCSKMSTEAKTSNVEDVLPNDEELGTRNCHWRKLLKKYEDASEGQSQHSMDIETAMELLDQDMSEESSVNDVHEDPPEVPSDDEGDTIKRQLMAVIPLRKQQWKENGLKEILDDNEFRMLSKEKVENWLQNSMHTITGQYNVHHHAEEVTTVMETQIEGDEDSLYSVDTAQYIRTNKQIKSKVKVTTMIKRYSVTSSTQRCNNFGIIPDEPQRCHSVPSTKKPTSPNKSPTEREIVEPLQSITLTAPKQPHEQPAGPAAACSIKPVKKHGGFQLNGWSHGEGLVVYRPKEIRPNLPFTERISLRVGDLNLTGVTKKHHLDMFEKFDYRVHPNSSICFYPSDSSDTADERNEEVDDSSTENSYDDDDPILTFNPHRLKLLRVVEVPYRPDTSLK
uniref:Uncharacterized protein n=1 Tax=Anopheles farauti TaxID=69004 RepID=A0A182QCG4_9DIPT